jgi:hypothetical protein
VRLTVYTRDGLPVLVEASPMFDAIVRVRDLGQLVHMLFMGAERWELRP